MRVQTISGRQQDQLVGDRTVIVQAHRPAHIVGQRRVSPGGKSGILMESYDSPRDGTIRFAQRQAPWQAITQLHAASVGTTFIVGSWLSQAQAVFRRAAVGSGRGRPAWRHVRFRSRRRSGGHDPGPQSLAWEAEGVSSASCCGGDNSSPADRLVGWRMLQGVRS